MTTKTAPPGGLSKSITLPHSEPLELYNNAFSSCSQKVRLCLAEAGREYSHKHIHLVETGWYETCSPDFKRINPGATVPVLVHEGHPVYESHDQIHYIDREFHANSLCPDGVRDEVEKWTDFVSIKGDPMAKENQEARLGACTVGLTVPIFASMIQDIPLPNILWGLLHHPNKERPVMFSALKLLGPYAMQLPPVLQLVRGGRRRCRKHLEELDRHLADGRGFVCGEAYTLGDVGLTAALNRLENGDFGFLFADLHNVARYWERLKARPSFQEAITSKELPIMTMAFARIKLWKEKHAWYREALETEQPVRNTVPLRAGAWLLPLLLLFVVRARARARACL